jgi:hypothetical protein
VWVRRTPRNFCAILRRHFTLVGFELAEGARR